VRRSKNGLVVLGHGGRYPLAGKTAGRPCVRKPMRRRPAPRRVRTRSTSVTSVAPQRDASSSVIQSSPCLVPAATGEWFAGLLAQRRAGGARARVSRLMWLTRRPGLARPSGVRGGGASGGWSAGPSQPSHVADSASGPGPALGRPGRRSLGRVSVRAGSARVRRRLCVPGRQGSGQPRPSSSVRARPSGVRATPAVRGPGNPGRRRLCVPGRRRLCVPGRRACPAVGRWCAAVGLLRSARC